MDRFGIGSSVACNPELVPPLATPTLFLLSYDGEARLYAVSLADVVPVGTRIVGDNDGIVGWIEIPDMCMGLEAHPLVLGCHGLPKAFGVTLESILPIAPIL